MSTQGASAVGIANVTVGGTVLDTWFPAPELGNFDSAGTVRIEGGDIPSDLALLAGPDEAREVDQVVVRTTIADLSAPPADAHDAYLRLHLLSHRLVTPHGVNLDGLFGLLSNVVWTNFGPCAVEGFEKVRSRLRIRGVVTVFGVDKFPRMVDYVVPSGVRIADA
ncbi:tetrahydrodipicolinate N-succinyltransferase, partial [Rhodococcus opacus]|nr:tetrahydrodipicolinate N-succinyltransferase [Rhodococcus opacus]